METLKREAVAAVLSRLGSDNFGMMKIRLWTDFNILLDEDGSYSMEDLQVALQKMFGAQGASLLMREIQAEMRMLADWPNSFCSDSGSRLVACSLSSILLLLAQDLNLPGIPRWTKRRNDVPMQVPVPGQAGKTIGLPYSRHSK
jgi:hypothetical protein